MSTPRLRIAAVFLRLWRWCQRHPALAASLTGTVFVLLAGIGVTWHLARERTAPLPHARNGVHASTQVLDRVTLLADIAQLQDMKNRAALLWQDYPCNIPDIEGWLTEADILRTRLPQHRRALEAMKARWTPGIDERWASSVEERWQMERLEKLVGELEAMLEQNNKLSADVARRLQCATALAADTTDHKTLWDEAIAAIEEEPQYNRLKIVRHANLVPIGPDPDSKLWEFAHPLTGKIPKRDPVTKRLTMSGESCIVLVLLPEGIFWMGAQREDSSKPNYDAFVGNQSPVHSVHLSPFFMSKYEVTQGQWMRVLGSNPSHFKSVEDGSSEDRDLLPVEMVSWEQCEAICRRMGLMLPSEAQWEYACRAGAGRPAYGVQDDVAWHGGNAAGRTHPIGLKAANAFGLHDTLGNVWEWCADWYDEKAYEKLPSEPLDPRGPAVGDDRVMRGGSWLDDPVYSSAGVRIPIEPTGQVADSGLRPARTLR